VHDFGQTVAWLGILLWGGGAKMARDLFVVKPSVLSQPEGGGGVGVQIDNPR